MPPFRRARKEIPPCNGTFFAPDRCDETPVAAGPGWVSDHLLNNGLVDEF